MIKNRTILALAIGSLALVGCDSKKDVAPPAAPAATPPAAPATPSASVPTPPPAPVVPPVPAASAPVVPSVTPAPDASVTPPVVPPAPTVVPPATPVTPPATPATPAAPSASGDVNADAKATLAQFGKDLAAKDWKAAAADLKTLNDEKDKLTPQMQDAVKKAQAEYDIAKGASGLKIPGLGGGDSNK